VDEFEVFFEESLDVIVELINLSRDRLGEAFDENVRHVDEEEVRHEFGSVVKEDIALNLAALYKVGVSLEVRNDYAGFIVLEIIGREIAATLAGEQPEKTLAEATFHYIDVHTNEIIGGENAGYDDVVAGIAAGLQCRLPGWDWQEREENL
ncbi:MAG: hypothetical protein SXQ77_01125, partial [Halobacteria archaeon]|nr:hypothetical protein [Halobacteria archaeon]